MSEPKASKIHSGKQPPLPWVQVFVPQNSELRREIIQSHHDPKLACHPGHDKSLSLVQSSFTWLFWCSNCVTMPKAHCTGNGYIITRGVRYYMGKGYYKRSKLLHGKRLLQEEEGIK
ncbi:uncharacterized protein VP01_2146g1 [Puccinia sorghi]|uniref:Integrase zinc-binding domain-containing protein n=1 Tax=Puccinia sorghi TaxID=27349 RepID=A0A0L6VBJ0_9BASI|nr:uncharacterized protein VP01_2146g1 [Puccinia sorghi]